MKKTLTFLAASALALAAGSAAAQSAGSYIVRLGATHIGPEVKSGDLSAPSFPGTTIDVGGNTALTGGITYMWTDHISIDLPLGLAFKNKVTGTGAIQGVGELATVRALPATLLGQYRFGEATSRFRPYVGAGAVYAYFYHADSTAALSGLTGGTPSNPTLMRMDSSAGPALQIGASYQVANRWSVDFNLIQTFLKTTGHLSTGQNIDVTLNPLAAQVAVGYRF
ncbi:MAG: OmpW family protein [Pelomonas sp.]|nr:OmpW family protein [Roseateles sp.]